MTPEDIVNKVQAVLDRDERVAFAYVHGSLLRGESYRDVDVAAYLKPDACRELDRRGASTLGFAIPTERAIEREAQCPADVQVLNAAPLSFRFRVVSAGRVIVDRDPDRRADFEYLARVEYFDFKPRRDEYLREALAR